MEATNPTTDADAALAALSPAPEPSPMVHIPEPEAPKVLTVEQAVVSLQQQKDRPQAAVEFLDRATIEEAEEENRRVTFMDAIVEARKPKPPPERPAMIIPVALAEQTAREMAAGRARVAAHEATELERRAIVAAHQNDKWQERQNQVIFRDPTYVPDQKKGQGNISGGQTRNV